jgi:hypothetical protein
MTGNPYESPRDPQTPPAVTPNPQVRVIPSWVVRPVLGIAALVLAADAVTQIRPEFRPAWLVMLTVPVELLLATCFFSIAIQKASPVAEK